MVAIKLNARCVAFRLVTWQGAHMRQALEGGRDGEHPIPSNPLCFPLPAVCLLAGDGTVPLSLTVRRKLPAAVKAGGGIIVVITVRIKLCVAALVIPPCIAAVVGAKGLFPRTGAVRQGLAAVAALPGSVVVPHSPAPFRTKASSSQGSTNTKIPWSVNWRSAGYVPANCPGACCLV